MTNDIQIYFDKESIGFSCDSLNPDKLTVDIWCLDSLTKLPLINSDNGEKLLDSDGNQAFFECSSDLLRNSIFESTSEIIFDANHDLSTNIGSVNQLYLDDNETPSKLGARGLIENPYWVETIKNNNYTGISVYGTFVNSLPEPTALNITRISFLDKYPGACNKERCFVKTAFAAWDAGAAEKRLFEKFSDADENLNNSSLSKYFAIVDGDGLKRGDYHYPIGDVIDGTAKITKDGIWTAYNFAKREEEQKRHPSLVGKLIKIMKKEGIELPPSVKAEELETQETETVISEEDKNKEITGNDNNNNIKNIDNVNNNIDEDELNNKNNEDDNMVKLSEEDRTFLADSISSAIKEGFENIKAGFKAEAPKEGPKGPEMEEVVTELLTVEPPDFWELAKDRIGLTEEEFGSLKDSAGKVPDLTEQLNSIQANLEASNEIVKGYKMKELSEKLPPAIWEGTEKIEVDGKETEVSKLELLYKEYSADTAKFTDKYLSEMVNHQAKKMTPGFAAGNANSQLTPDKVKRNEELAKLR